MRNAKEIKTKKLRWVDISKPGPQAIKYLKGEFPFELLDLKDTMPERQRPKLIERENYIFMVLLFPWKDRETGEVKTTELDIFLSCDYLVTVHDNTFEPVKKVFRTLKKSKKDQEIMMKDPSTLLFEILHPVYTSRLQIITELGRQIDKVEELLFEVHRKETIEEILKIRKQITTFRMNMQNHRGVFNKLLASGNKCIVNPKSKHVYLHLIQHTTDIWNYLETYRDAINALHESHSSLSTHFMNNAIKTLTIISVFTFPLSLVAATFALPADHVPLIGSEFGFYKVLAIMLSIGLTMLIGFKWKKWI